MKLQVSVSLLVAVALTTRASVCLAQPVTTGTPPPTTHGLSPASGGPAGLAPASGGPGLAPASAGPIDEQSEFEKGRNAYRAHEYEEADARFLRMLDPEHGLLHDRLLIKQARMYWAATRTALHQDEDARLLFEVILTEDSAYEPDPLAFPADVRDAFIDTRARLREKLEAQTVERYRKAAERKANEEAAKTREAARIKMLEKLAAEALAKEKHSRWVALLPFGIGQFQNRQRTLGWFFLGAEGTLLAAGAATVPLYYVELANVHATLNPGQTSANSVAEQYNNYANDVRIVNLVLYGTLAATAIVGAIQAEVAYVPEFVHTEPRAVPDAPAAPAPSHPTSSLPVSFGAAPLAGRDSRGMGGALLSISAVF